MSAAAADTANTAAQDGSTAVVQTKVSRKVMTVSAVTYTMRAMVR